MTTPRLHRHGLLAYIRRAWVSGGLFPAMGYLTDWTDIHVLNLATRVPFLGPRLLAHEWWHAADHIGNEGHEPWWTFDVRGGHYLRLFDRADIMTRSATWRANPPEN